MVMKQPLLDHAAGPAVKHSALFPPEHETEEEALVRERQITSLVRPWHTVPNTSSRVHFVPVLRWGRAGLLLLYDIVFHYAHRVKCICVCFYSSLEPCWSRKAPRRPIRVMSLFIASLGRFPYECTFLKFLGYPLMLSPFLKLVCRNMAHFSLSATVGQTSFAALSYSCTERTNSMLYRYLYLYCVVYLSARLCNGPRRVLARQPLCTLTCASTPLGLSLPLALSLRELSIHLPNCFRRALSEA